MKKTVHRAADRGREEHGWLSTRYSFSFADWYEPSRMGFGALRVINDDWIAPASGFPPHSHRDMEIITIVRAGAVAHQDSTGGRGVVHAGEAQTMSAGSGVIHSEYNESESEPLELFQIWIETAEKGIAPQYAERSYADELEKEGRVLIAARGHAHALPIAQDAQISIARAKKGELFEYALARHGNGVYILVIEGAAQIADEQLGSRDAIGIEESSSISIETTDRAELLIIEVPMTA